MNEMNEALMDKNDSIEQSPEKANVRINIYSQTEQLAMILDLKKIEAVSLCAKLWYFEKGLNNVINHSFNLKTIPEIVIHGIEGSEGIAVASVKERPANCDITNCFLVDYFRREPTTDSNGTSFLTARTRTTPLDISLLFADFCRPANLLGINEFIEMIDTGMKQGLGYITVSLNPRGAGTRQEVAKELGWGKFNDSEDTTVQLANAVKAKIKELFKKSSINAELVYDVIYNGGELERSRMLTLGYAINLPKNCIKPIFENRSESKAELNKVNKDTHKEMVFRGGWKMGYQKPAKQVKEVKEAGEVVKGKRGRPRIYPEGFKKTMSLEKAVMFFGGGKWKNLSEVERIAVAGVYGISHQSFQGKAAHFSGKFLKKKLECIEKERAALVARKKVVESWSITKAA